MAQMERICLQCGRTGFDPLSGRSPGEGSGYLIRYSSLYIQWLWRLQELFKPLDLRTKFIPRNVLLLLGWEHQYVGGFPGEASGKEPACQCRRQKWVRSLGWEDPLEKGTVTHSVFLPGESHGQRNLVGYSPQGHKELDVIGVKQFSMQAPICRKSGPGPGRPQPS